MIHIHRESKRPEKWRIRRRKRRQEIRLSHSLHGWRIETPTSHTGPLADESPRNSTRAPREENTPFSPLGQWTLPRFCLEQIVSNDDTSYMYAFRFYLERNFGDLFSFVKKRGSNLFIRSFGRIEYLVAVLGDYFEYLCD